MKTLRLAPLLAAALCLGGCWSYPVDVAEATRPLKNAAYTEMEPTSGWSTGFSILHIFSFGPDDPLGRARDQALARVKGNALIDARARIDHISFLLLFSIHTTTVEGTAVLEDESL
ncbi:MAG: hypothetical protein HY812_11840 [Planctomycetes bacterium]|nr:hypothetical protein [Planctomycetota bacterium]